MQGVFHNIINSIYLAHLNILVLLGVALFGGTVGGRIFQKLRIPQVVGYIVIGIIIGESGLKIIDSAMINTLEPFSYFALGLIGFMIGGELKLDIFLKYGRQLLSILLFEGITAFIMVALLVGTIGTFLFGDWRLAWSLGLLLGAIASATAPAATTDVLWEYKARGPLTRTVLSIVALDDGLALLLFAFASSAATLLTGGITTDIAKLFIHPAYEIGGSLVIGIVSGVVLSKVLKTHTEKDRVLAFSIGTVLLVLGLSLATKVDMLLASMTLGVIIVNYARQKSSEIFKLVQEFTPPIYILFFVLVGAKLNISDMSLSVALLVIIYLLARSAGKMIGANAGARISGAPQSVQRYLPFCLFSQAGVAIGLSIVAAQIFPDKIGNTIVIVITATTFVVQLLGPSSTRFAVIQSGEAGLNVTEEDILRRTTTREILDSSSPPLYAKMHLTEIFKVFSTSTNMYYPVIDDRKRLLGVINIDNVRATLMETGLDHLILAHDFMDPAPVVVGPDVLLTEARRILDKNDLEYLPVVEKDNTFAGLIEKRVLGRIVTAKIVELQKKVDSLDKTV